MAGRLVELAGWLATQVFDVVGSVAGVQGADGGTTVDLQVGKTVFFDVPVKMRTELWLSQLHRKASDGTTPSAGEYYDLLFEKLSPDVLAEIDKDTHRTFPGHTWLSSPTGQKAMLNVLRAYALSDPEIGYTQGMNFLVGLLLTYLPSEADAYAALSLLMRQRGLREMYLPDMSLLQIRLWQLSKLLPPRLAAHLEAHAALPVLYASSWLLTCFAADFPLHFAARVVDVLMTGQGAASPMLKVAVGIVSHCEAALLKMGDFEDIVNYLRQEVPQWSKPVLHDLLTDALSKPWSARQLRVLDQINGAETVMEAVTRVNRLASQSTVEAAEAQAALEESASSPTPPLDAPPGAQQEQQQQQVSPTQQTAAGAASTAAAGGERRGPLTPRTMARSLSNSFRLPKVPAGPPGKAVPAGWASWKATPDLESLPPQKVRIDRSVAADLDLVQLDPQLSQALSAYSPHDTSRHGSGSAPAQWSPVTLPRASSSQQQQPPPQQQQQQAEGSLVPEEAAARWEAFAHQSSIHLMAAPSPFDAGPPDSSGTPRFGLPPPGTPPAPRQQPTEQAPVSPPPAAAGASAAPPDAAASSPAAAAVAAGELPAARTSPAAAADYGSDSAPSYGSFQMTTLNSALPLVDLSEQQQQRGRGQAEAGGAGAAAAGDDGGGSGSANLIQDAPSSHGSSLAAVLHALSLNANWASSRYDTATSGGDSAAGSVSGGAPPAAGAPPNRRLRHSSEVEEWCSFKTAAGSEQGGFEGQHSLGQGLSGLDSWQSTGHYDGQPSGLSSDGSGSVAAPSMHHATGWRSGSSSGLGRPSARQLSAVGSSSLPLTGEAATRRAASLQEEHLQGFRVSGKKDAAKKP